MKTLLIVLLIAAAFVWLLYDISVHGFDPNGCANSQASVGWC